MREETKIWRFLKLSWNILLFLKEFRCSLFFFFLQVSCCWTLLISTSTSPMATWTYPVYRTVKSTVLLWSVVLSFHLSLSPPPSLSPSIMLFFFLSLLARDFSPFYLCPSSPPPPTYTHPALTNPPQTHTHTCARTLTLSLPSAKIFLPYAPCYVYHFSMEHINQSK